MTNDHFQRRTVISGGLAWLTRVTQAVLSLGAAVVLARLLSPEDFGVFAMVVPLGVVANQLAGQCFQTALLQHHDLTPGDSPAFFLFAVRANFLLSALMIVLGLALAWFYNEPRVPAVVAAWSAATWLLTLTTFQEAMLKRDLRFPVVLAAQFIGLLAGITAAIVAAWRGAGYWALPLQLLVMEATRASGVAFTSRWLPRLADESVAGHAVQLRRAWWSLAGFRLTTWINDQPDLLAVGRIGGAFTLGVYDTARRWAWYPFEEPYVILSDVTVAGATAGRNDPAYSRRVLTLAMMSMLTLSLPLIGFVGTAADDVVATLLGKQWLEAIPYLRILCVMAAAGAVVRVMYWIPLARGAPQILFRWSVLVQMPVTVSAVLIGLRWGPWGVATAMASAWSALVVPCLFFVTQKSPIRASDVVGAVWRPIVVTAIGMLAVLFARSFVPVDPGIERLIASLVIFAISVLLAWLVMPGGWSITQAAVRSLRAAPVIPTGA